MEEVEGWVPTFDQTARLSINGFLTSQLDEENVLYFTGSKPSDKHCGLYRTLQVPYSPYREEANKKPLLIIGVCFYNEEPEELRRTLVSIADQVFPYYENESVDVKVIVCGDGHTQMHSKTRKYLRRLFANSKQENMNLKSLFNSMDVYAREKAAADEDERNGVAIDQRRKAPPHVTYIIRSKTPVNIRGAKDGDNNRFLDITLVYKGINRRKHHSQECMFRFVKETVEFEKRDPSKTFVFLTDCGTLFGDKCIIRLTSYMLIRPKCAGCTGRQRVMSAEDQDCPDESLAERLLRLVQAFDYEASYAYATGTFSLLGILPVLPGPCSMMRYSALINKRNFRPVDPLQDLIDKPFPFNLYEVRKSESMDRLSMSMDESIDVFSGDDDIIIVDDKLMDVQWGTGNIESERPITQSAWEHFSSIVATPPQQTSLVIENLKLAEDRIPSYAIVTHGQEKSYTTWVDGAVFYFQAETALKTFAAQRRRWTNGALFSYVFLILGNVGLLCGSKMSLARKCIVWFLFFLQMMSYVMAMFSPAIFGSGLYLGLISLFEGGGKEFIIAVVVFYSVYFFVFTWWHRYVVFNQPVFFIMVILNALVMIFVLAGFFRQSISWGFYPTGIDRQILQYFTLAVMTIPFLMAIIALDFKSLWMMIKAAVPFVLFLPTLSGSFALYSLARVSDTSWGNRVSVAGSNFKGATTNQLQDLQRDLSSNALVGLIFITVLNGVVEAIVIYYGVNSWFIVGVLCFIFFSTIIQVILATIYFVGKHVSGLTFWERCGCCLCGCCKRRKRLDYKRGEAEHKIKTEEV